MSVRDVIRNATPEYLKAPVSSKNFYETMEAVTEAFQALKKRVEAIENREKDAQQKALLDRVQALEEGALIGIGFGGALAGFSGMSPDNVAPPIALGSIALFACFRLWRVEIRNNG